MKLIACLLVALAAGLAAPAASAQNPNPWPAYVAGGGNPLTGTWYAANGRHASAAARVDAGLGRVGRRVATFSAGARPLLRGRLRDERGRAIGGAVLIVAREVVDRPGWQAVRRVRTSPGGRFRTMLSPAWAPRRFAVVYWPFASSPAPAFSAAMLARAAPRVWLRAVPRRRGLVSMRGRVTGSRVPVGGLLVALEIRNRASWAAVRLVRTNGSGRFAGRYRFAVRGRRFTVRARVPRQAGWRLHTGVSRPLRIRPR